MLKSNSILNYREQQAQKPMAVLRPIRTPFQSNFKHSLIGFHLGKKLSIRSQAGFTLVELIVAIAIIGILSSFAFINAKNNAQKAYKTEIKTQLNAASKKLIPALIGASSLQESECLDYSELKDSQTFTYSCSKRENQSDIFDIHVKPLKDIGVGGILSFGKNRDKICWDTCEAFGFGINAELAKNHLGLSDNCSALTKQIRTYKCNCISEPVKIVLEHAIIPFIIAALAIQGDAPTDV